METITYNLKTVTPVFCSGEGDNAELRASSFKGVIRYWYRSAAAEKGLKKLHRKENDLFGSTEEGAGFALRIKGLNQINNQKENKVTEYILPHRNKAPIQALKTNLPFVLEFKMRKGTEKKKEVTTSLEIALLLGGIGKRSRRGFGSIEKQQWDFSTPKEFLNYLASQLEVLEDRNYRVSENKLEIKEETEYEYPVLKKSDSGTQWETG